MTTKDYGDPAGTSENIMQSKHLSELITIGHRHVTKTDDTSCCHDTAIKKDLLYSPRYDLFKDFKDLGE